MLTQAELKSLFRYDPETGEFWHLAPYAGQKRPTLIAGTVMNKGYVMVRIRNKGYLAHRLAWLYVYGVWPNMVDHINGNRLDNRQCNLRICTAAENNRNARIGNTNTSGLKGVHWDKAGQIWRAQIHVNGRNRTLGRFKDREQARLATRKRQKSCTASSFAKHNQAMR